MDDRTRASLHEIAAGYHERPAELRKFLPDAPSFKDDLPG